MKNSIKKIFIVYPCGKKFELRVPFIIQNSDGANVTIFPGHELYLVYAKQKFQINNLKVTEEEVYVESNKKQGEQKFISLAKKKCAID